MIQYKSSRQIEKIKNAGRVVSEVLDLISENVRPGVTTGELDSLTAKFLKSKNAKSAFLGYQGFPANICASVDSEVVHGIPGERELLNGQILSVDFGAIVDGYYGDSARTFAVGEISDDAEKLLEITEESLYVGIKKCVVDNKLGDLSAAIQSYVEAEGFSVVRDLVGHGIGRKMHEEPQVPNFGETGTGMELKEGLVIAIEPMINAGGFEVRVMDDGWTVVTADGSLSAHFEHTVAITSNGPEILTLSKDE
ncbi:MAG: type I methionyl aminopeptidase [candidate division Zixibacteria bacterium]